MTLNLDQRLSLGSDDETDLVKELESMCSSKSESDISKVSSMTGEDMDRSAQQQRGFLGPYRNTHTLRELSCLEKPFLPKHHL